MLGNLLCPADQRIQSFLQRYLGSACPQGIAQIPGNTFLLDRPGLARVLSLPQGADTFTSPYLKSYRVPQGVLHNPKTDRRTTQGYFTLLKADSQFPKISWVYPRRLSRHF